jgi:ParB family chromosome partitioning protein
MDARDRMTGYRSYGSGQSVLLFNPAHEPAGAPNGGEFAPKGAGSSDAGGIKRIPVERIHVGLNPREHFDQEKLDELAKSIQEHGLLQPISVREHAGGYQIIAGERRYRAMQQLGWTHVPAIVHDVGDQEAHELALIENISRADMRPGETARAYKNLVDRGMSIKEIAERTGKSESHIQQHLDMLTLAPHLQKAVDDGRLSLSVVRDLAKLSPRGQEEAAERILSQDLGVRSAKVLIRSIHDREAQTSMFPTAAPVTKAERDARQRYDDAVRRMTETLHGLDDETMAHFARAVDSPTREIERLDLMVKQLRRMQNALEYAHHSRTGAPMTKTKARTKRTKRVAATEGTRMSIFARIWDLRSVRLDEGSDGMKRSWIMLFPQGQYHHPQYGKLDFSAQRLAEIKRHFDDGVRGIDIGLDENHDQNKATGWIESVELRPAQDGLPAGLWGCIRWTKLGEQDIRDQIYRYFSPEFGPHTDERTGKQTQDVLLGGGLTNRPFLKDMPAVALQEGTTRMTTRKTNKTNKTKGQTSDDEEDDDAKMPAESTSDDEEYAEDEEMDEGADGEDDDSEDDDEDEEDVPPSKGKPGKGKFAPFKKGIKNGKKMSEGQRMREDGEVVRLREQVLAQSRKLYAMEVNEVLAGWERGQTFTFSERRGTVQDPDRGDTRSREGRIAITPRAARAVKSFLLSEGFTLAESTRNAVLDLVQVILSEKLVDLSARGGSYDMEARKTIRQGGVQRNDTEATEISLAETAAQLAKADKKVLSEMDLAEREKYFMRAAHEINY